MVPIKDRNSRDLVGTEEIKKRWKEYMEELYNEDLNEPDYYDGVVSHPEPDILECEVKWALGSTAVNKASGCDGIPVELFKTLKDDAIKVFHSVCQQTWKTQQWPQDWKGQSSSQFPKRIVKVKLKVTQLCPTLCDPMDCVVHGILQTRILAWVAFPFFRGSSQPRD